MWLDGKEFLWYPNESLLKRMESEGIIKLIFPLHGIKTSSLMFMLFHSFEYDLTNWSFGLQMKQIESIS